MSAGRSRAPGPGATRMLVEEGVCVAKLVLVGPWLSAQRGCVKYSLGSVYHCP